MARRISCQAKALAVATEPLQDVPLAKPVALEVVLVRTVLALPGQRRAVTCGDYGVLAFDE